MARGQLGVRLEFAQTRRPPPRVAVYEERAHAWALAMDEQPMEREV